MFGETWSTPSSNEEKKKAGDIVSNIPLAAAGALSGKNALAASPAGSPTGVESAPKLDWTLPVVIGIGTLVTLVLVLIGSGGVPAKNAPKALLLVISGLKGTEFMDAVVDGPYAPNMRLLLQTGSFAPCLHADDGRCCRTQDGPHLGPDYTFGSAPGIASILTGVNSNKHRVNNDTYDAMSHFASSSATYPTILKMAKDASFTTAVVGAKYMMATLGSGGRCSEYGVLDFECGDDAVTRCLARSSCNSDLRVPLPPSFDVADQAPFSAAVEEYSRASSLIESDNGKVFEITNEAVNFINAGSDVVVVHINALELASNNAADGGDYTAQSKLSMAALYLTDAIVGQLTSVVGRRVEQSRENWLIVGVADHGGYNSTNGKRLDEDELVAFFATTYTLAGHLALQAPFPPVRQYDAAPTILRWMGIPVPSYMDGSAQMICSDGVNVANCSEVQNVVADSP